MEFKQNHPELFVEEKIVPITKKTKLKMHVKDSAKVVIEKLGNLRELALDAEDEER